MIVGKMLARRKEKRSVEVVSQNEWGLAMLLTSCIYDAGTLCSVSVNLKDTYRVGMISGFVSLET